MEKENTDNKLIALIGDSLLPYTAADSIIAEVKKGSSNVRNNVMNMLVVYLTDALNRKNKFDSVLREGKNKIEAPSEEDLRGPLISFNPAGDTSGLRKKEVFAAYELLDLNDEVVILLITAFGIRRAPASEMNRARLASLGFAIVPFSLGQLKCGIAQLATSLDIKTGAISVQDTEILEEAKFDPVFLRAKDIDGKECLVKLHDGKLWCFDWSDGNYQQIKDWKFFIEELKVKPQGPKLK